MAALFSCTKCHKRYPFDELSQGEQLCKECRNNFPVVKCTYCRAEFQQNSKGSTSSICAKCAQNVKNYGKPTACENCSVLAAFIGNRCQRCVNSEKKWGRPLVCEQCKLKCAFDRPERRKLDGKLMCWLCDQSYKRVLAKTRKPPKSSSFVESSSKSNTPTLTTSQSQPAVMPASFEGMTVLERLTKLAAMEENSQGDTPPVLADKKHENRHSEEENRFESSGAQGEDTEEKEKSSRGHKSHHRKHHHHHHKSRSHGKRHVPKEEEEAGDLKKQKPDKNATNGGTATATTAAASTPKSTGNNVSEAAGEAANMSENMILITQLREQIESLKKQMVGKDQQLLEKDKKVNEVKAHMYENDKEFRSRIHNIQRTHASAIETLQTKNRELTRQVASLSKGKKSSSDTSVSSSVTLTAV